MKNKNRLLTLAARLKSVDRHMVHLLALRTKLASEVAMIKIEDSTPLYRESIETDRLNAVSEWARMDGINPEFARSVLYPIIGESCKTQMTLIDQLRLKGVAEKFNPTLQELRQNLISLTDAWALQYDDYYGTGHPATVAFSQYEQSIIDDNIRALGNNDFVLDLGCATGRELRRIAHRFKRLQGFDISHSMIEVGRMLNEDRQLKNLRLHVHDIETQLPLTDNSVSMVIMNCGTGSDVSDITSTFAEIRRVLMPGGRFVISFYNREAWTQKVFFPWPLGLVAGIDQDRNCLEVYDGTKYVPIFARPYSLGEIESLIPSHLSILSSATYPTLAAILPPEIIEATNSDGVIAKIDNAIAQLETGLGAYIVISGRKV